MKTESTPSPVFKRNAVEQLWLLAEKLTMKFNKLDGLKTTKTIRTEAYLVQVLTVLYRNILQHTLGEKMLENPALLESNPKEAVNFIKSIIMEQK